MNEGELQSYLHRHIPISSAMGITVVSATRDRVELRAALEPNLNHQSTAFGRRSVRGGACPERS